MSRDLGPTSYYAAQSLLIRCHKQVAIPEIPGAPILKQTQLGREIDPAYLPLLEGTVSHRPQPGPALPKGRADFLGYAAPCFSFAAMIDEALALDETIEEDLDRYMRWTIHKVVRHAFKDLYE